MGIVAIASNVQTSLPMDVIAQGGALATVSLIISLSIALLISDSKYWNRWAESTLAACANPILVTFAAIVAYKIMLIL